jgi:hypothetical protein
MMSAPLQEQQPHQNPGSTTCSSALGSNRTCSRHLVQCTCRYQPGWHQHQYRVIYWLCHRVLGRKSSTYLESLRHRWTQNNKSSGRLASQIEEVLLESRAELQLVEPGFWCGCCSCSGFVVPYPEFFSIYIGCNGKNKPWRLYLGRCGMQRCGLQFHNLKR